MKRYFQISCHALIISAFIALALTGQLDAPSIAVFTVGVLGSLYRTIKGMPPLLGPQGGFYLSFVYILFFFFDSAIISRSFIPATIHLVLFLELVKLYQDKSDKDYLYLIILAFLKILAASSLTIDMSFVATLLLFLVALISTLMSFDMYRCESRARLKAHTAATSLGGMSIWSTFWIIVLGTGLFFIIPRVGTGYFSRASTSALLLSGFAETVQLGEIGQVKLSTTVVMRARRLNGARFALLKWRGIALDTFDGRAWHKTDRSRRPIRRAGENRFTIGAVRNRADMVRYSILLEPLATTAIFAPYEVRSVVGNLPGLEIDEDRSIYVRFQQARRLQYEVTSEVQPQTLLAQDLETDSQTAELLSARFLQLPRNLDPRIAELALDITAAGESVTDKALLVEAYLKRNHPYTLELTWDPGEQPISTFLFNARAGHCEYFASSMAILLRAAGIPTRIVNGFLMGEYNPVADDYIIRQSDAHSWVEVYIPGRGWVEFDPTPPDPNSKDIDFATQISHYIDAAQMFWNSYILTFDSTSQMQLFHSAQDRVQALQNSFRDRFDGLSASTERFSDHLTESLQNIIETAWFWVMLVSAAVAREVYRRRRMLRTRWQVWRLRKGRGAVNAEVIEHLFYEAARLAERENAERKAGQTWREWVASMPEGMPRRILFRALDVFERSRYGCQPASDGDFRILEEAIRELRGS